MWLEEFEDLVRLAGVRIDAAGYELWVDDPQAGRIEGAAASPPTARAP